MYESILQFVAEYHTTLWVIDITVLVIAVTQLAIGVVPKVKRLFSGSLAQQGQERHPQSTANRLRRRAVDTESTTRTKSAPAPTAAVQASKTETHAGWEG